MTLQPTYLPTYLLRTYCAYPNTKTLTSTHHVEALEVNKQTPQLYIHVLYLKNATTTRHAVSLHQTPTFTPTVGAKA